MRPLALAPSGVPDGARGALRWAFMKPKTGTHEHRVEGIVGLQGTLGEDNNSAGEGPRDTKQPAGWRLSDYGYLWVQAFSQFAIELTCTPSSCAIANCVMPVARIRRALARLSSFAAPLASPPSWPR